MSMSNGWQGRREIKPMALTTLLMFFRLPPPSSRYLASTSYLLLFEWKYYIIIFNLITRSFSISLLLVFLNCRVRSTTRTLAYRNAIPATVT
ncbi:hypothetical protein CI102_4587 [Trichoderma harzianum]|nr:hypothetical protein CI102_4587 [Trichoderma harzianum]